MARYTGPRLKLSRREGVDLEHLSNLRDINTKCNFETKPGQVSQRNLKSSDYAIQLREKQKLKRLYGLLEKQFANYYKKASRMIGLTGENLMFLLETRLDNVVFRMGFAATRAEARQLVSHGGILVNDAKTNIPSYRVIEGDCIALTPRAQKQTRVQEAMERSIDRFFAPWIEMDKFRGILSRLPKRDEIPFQVDESLIIELYSK